MTKSLPTVLLAGMLLIMNYAFAQYIYPEQELCEELKQRTLAVQLLSGDDETTQNLNSALKEEFQAWTITPVLFKSADEIAQIMDARDTQYAILIQDDAVKEDKRSRTVDQNGRLVVGPGNGATFKQYYTAFSFSYYNFQLLLPTEKKKPEEITSIGFANGELSRIDYLYLVQQLNRLIRSSLDGVPSSDYYDPEKAIAKIEASKLLLLADLFREKEISDIPSNYDHDFEVVDMDRYQDAILNKEAGSCYAKIIWSNQINLYEWIVVNAENGEILSQLTFGGVKFGASHEANDIIKVKHLKYVTNKMAQKVNNKY